MDFDRAWRRRVLETIGEKAGLQAAFISADDLIVATEAAGRPQDLAVVAALREAQTISAVGAKPTPIYQPSKAKPKAPS